VHGDAERAKRLWQSVEGGDTGVSPPAVNAPVAARPGAQSLARMNTPAR
jgi:hypothetical protein